MQKCRLDVDVFNNETFLGGVCVMVYQRLRFFSHGHDPTIGICSSYYSLLIRRMGRHASNLTRASRPDVSYVAPRYRRIFSLIERYRVR